VVTGCEQTLGAARNAEHRPDRRRAKRLPASASRAFHAPLLTAGNTGCYPYAAFDTGGHSLVAHRADFNLGSRLATGAAKLPILR